MVWKSSERVGFGKAQGVAMAFIVALYDPPGNAIGEFEQNVDLRHRSNADLGAGEGKEFSQVRVAA